MKSSPASVDGTDAKPGILIDDAVVISGGGGGGGVCVGGGHSTPRWSVDEFALRRSESQMTTVTMLTSFTVRTDVASLHDYPVGWEERLMERVGRSVAHQAKNFSFCFTLVSSSLGFGNMYRFPSLILKYGSSFYVSYIISVLVCALPCTLLELTVGQYTGLGPIRSCRSVAPVFTGLGIANVMTSAFCSVYWNMTHAWLIYYLYNSFFTPLPWLTCTNAWNTHDCFSIKNDEECRAINQTFFYGGCQTMETFCASRLVNGHRFAAVPGETRSCQNLTSSSLVSLSVLRGNTTHPPAEFFKRSLLQDAFVDGTDASLTRLGDLSFPVLICNSVAWAMTFFYIVLVKNASNKAYVATWLTATTMFKALLMSVLVLRAVTLPNAGAGLTVFGTDWVRHLMDPNLWFDSMTHTIYCSGVGFGGLFSLATRNDFHHAFVWDSIGLCFMNAVVSTLMSLAFYAYVGEMWKNADGADGNTITSVTVNKVIKYGFGLIFSTYPEAMAVTPVPNLWSILLFSMLTFNTLDSESGMVKVVVLAVEEAWPVCVGRRFWVTLCICVSGFLLSLPLCFQGGIYLIILMIDFSAVSPLLLVCLLNVLGFIFVYGREKLLGHFEEMVKPGVWVKRYLKITWLYSVPVILLICTFVSFVFLAQPAAVILMDSPLTTNVLGWSYVLVHILPIPFAALVEIWRSFRKNEPLMRVLMPTAEWIPAPTRKLREQIATRKQQLLQHQPDADTSAGRQPYRCPSVTEISAQADIGSLFSVGNAALLLECDDSPAATGGAQQQQQQQQEPVKDNIVVDPLLILSRLKSQQQQDAEPDEQEDK